MASNRQIYANRKNAKKKYAPTTALGKARSTRNALRHGRSQFDAGDNLNLETLPGDQHRA
jgi:hypothetical protein